MGGQIVLERGTSGKMKNWGLSWSLDYKKQSSHHTDLLGSAPLVLEFSAGGQATPWRVS